MCVIDTEGHHQNIIEMCADKEFTGVVHLPQYEAKVHVH